MDLLVARVEVVEIKAVETIAPVHKAQLITYLRLGGWKVGLLINFNIVLLKNGFVVECWRYKSKLSSLR